MAEVYIGLGGNLGDVLATFAAALEELPRRGVMIVARSRHYRTAALVPPGAPPGPDYWNAVAHGRTEFSPQALLSVLRELEAKAGRERRARWAARTLDLDLLLYDDLILSDAELTLPHPRLAERGFVLLPLCELAPQLRIPGHRASASDLLARLPARERTPLEVRAAP